MSKSAIALTVVLAAAVIGVWAVATIAEDAKPGKTAMVSLPADELAKAVQDIQDAKKDIPADQKDAIAKLDAALKILEAAKSSATQPAAVAPAAGGGDTFTGPVHATMSRKQPRIVVDGTQYDLKASDKADAAAKETLDKISKGETGDFVVKGKKEGSTILVDSITKK
ncbi:MAG: hypothetical protein ACE15C_04980 [Phycisphaerae bacterium]